MGSARFLGRFIVPRSCCRALVQGSCPWEAPCAHPAASVHNVLHHHPLQKCEIKGVSRHFELWIGTCRCVPCAAPLTALRGFCRLAAPHARSRSRALAKRSGLAVTWSWQRAAQAGRNSQELWEIRGESFFLFFFWDMPRVGNSDREYLAQHDGSLASCPSRMLLPGAFGPIILSVNKTN